MRGNFMDDMKAYFAMRCDELGVPEEKRAAVFDAAWKAFQAEESRGKTLWDFDPHIQKAAR